MKANTKYFMATVLIMPLVVMCGFPSSGKTQVTNRLKLYFEEEREKKVQVIGDDSIGVDRNVAYASKCGLFLCCVRLVEANCRIDVKAFKLCSGLLSSKSHVMSVKRHTEHAGNF